MQEPTPAESEVERLEVLQLTVGPLQVNAYVLLAGSQAVVVDPGDEGARIAAELAERGASLAAVWLTHAHFDHVGGISALLANRPAGSADPVPVFLHPLDQPVIEHAVTAAARWSLTIEAPPTNTVALEHGQTLHVGRAAAKVLHTPGHAPGHVAFYFPQHDLVFSGDALFKGSIGRTDLPLADEGQLLDSIRRELLSLPDSTAVLPGHGPATSIGVERFGNPFL